MQLHVCGVGGKSVHAYAQVRAYVHTCMVVTARTHTILPYQAGSNQGNHNYDKLRST